MKCHANRILHDGFVRHNRIASRNVAKCNRNQSSRRLSFDGSPEHSARLAATGRRIRDIRGVRRWDIRVVLR